ncbi:DUF1178 family protein [Novosphingobium cyanobacteriorum]|uniref:DUF1178 family protein n=1 Tax=Novosphingobium cyanobacteriorum TaxID=3024215 RepID=A0ABT6CKM6_9SPHN|nr:DUF1178 family protein [Novosphingobium cyanobacteriorum]MDF8334103.1 DUF1178 family protein [Novosphingobium cyanobacteriorum]
MIVFDLECRNGGHRFEGWFGSSDDFAIQQERGLLTCPTCGSADVGKAVMAPNVGRKGNQMPAMPMPVPAQADKPQAMATTPMPPEAVAMLKAVAAMQAEALKSSTWVGDSFAEDARAMHYGEKDAAPIHGQATPDEAMALVEEGIEIAPILFPVVPPEKAN